MGLLAELFLVFAKIGFFTFGGGYAMLSLIEDTCVGEKHWITHEEMMDITVVAESTPGPIAINCATYVGGRLMGIRGAAAATLGVALPSFAVIYGISMFLERFLEIRWVAGAFQGIKIAVGLLILNAAFTMLKKMPKKPFPIGIAAGSCLVLLAAGALPIRISSIALMIAAGLFSYVMYTTGLWKEGRK